MLTLLASVVAPTTLVTGLLYTFGRLTTAGYFWYLGLPLSAVGLTDRDYLFQSMDPLLAPLLAFAVAMLLALWAHQLLLTPLRAEARRIVLRVLMLASAIVGGVLLSMAMDDFVRGPVFPDSFPEGRGLSLSLGALLLGYAASLLRLLVAERRPGQVPRYRGVSVMVVAEWGALFILVIVGLFWAVGSYAIGVGIVNAQELELSLPARAEVVLYSERSLNLQAPGVREVTCQNPASAYRFRYEGLKLIHASEKQYIFLPVGWTYANDTAIILPRSETLRLEVGGVGRVRSGTC
jgi:hypothetical protein